MLEGSLRVVSMRKSGVKPEPHETVIRIDRETPWGNPYEIGKDGTREEVIALFEQNIQEKHREFCRMLARRVHAGENLALACWCSPDSCHGDVYRELIITELNNIT